ncbi:MAG: tetratricopeptide repeat protein [Planctomycetaceae bacterium]
MTTDPNTLFTQAADHHRAGDFSSAISLYKQVLESSPDHLDARYLLGTALLQVGRFEESIEQLTQIVEQRSDVADVHNNLGIAHKATGNWEQAVRSFEAALKINPDYSQAYFNLGSLMEQRSLFADAEKCYRHALRLNSSDTDARLALANVLKAQAKWPEAEMAYRECQRTGATDESLSINLAFVLAKQERLEEAAVIYREILARQPDFAEIHASLSYLDERRGNLSDALEAAQRATTINPDYAEGYNNLGIALRSLHRLDKAVESFKMALERNPEFALAEFNLGTTHLLAGNYRDGWPGYERRAEAMGERPRSFMQPHWAGESLVGKNLFVFADQGFGDTIQFSRFLAEAKSRSQAKLIFECQPELTGLFQNSPDVDQIIPVGNPLPEFAAWISLASLPRIFDVTLETLSSYRVELNVESALRKDLLDVLRGASDSRRKVGLVWRGNPEQARDVVRSCPVEFLSRLLDVDGVQFFSLQTGLANTPDQNWLEDQTARNRLVDIGSHLESFTETAEVIEQLDLVITVDTATAHLAGTLGGPVWTMLCHTPDWRWGLQEPRTAWYPEMRLFRQQQWGDWGTVIENVVDGLRIL